MTSPEVLSDTAVADFGDVPLAISSRLMVMRKRSDFVRASRALHVATTGFVLQMRHRGDAELADANDQIRIGFTCSKKVGNAVARNRAKRRLRAIAQIILPQAGMKGMDYVLIGRKGATADLPFLLLQQDLRDALAKLHARTK